MPDSKEQAQAAQQEAQNAQGTYLPYLTLPYPTFPVIQLN